MKPVLICDVKKYLNFIGGIEICTLQQKSLRQQKNNCNNSA